MLDLNDDCLLTTIDSFGLLELCTLANVTQRFKSLAGNVFLRKFSDKIKFASPKEREPQENDFDGMLEDGFTTFLNFDTAIKVLNAFGHLMKSIKVELRQMGRKWGIDYKDDLIYYIGQYCADTVTTFEMHKLYTYYYGCLYLDAFRKNFTNVDTLTLSGFYNMTYGRLYLYHQKLNVVFPSVKKLYFKEFSFDNFVFVGDTFPNLEYLYADLYPQNVEKIMNEHVLQGILRNNSQIRSLELQWSNHSVLRMVDRELRQLENLTLNSHFEPTDAIHDDLSDIRLDSVKRLKMRNGLVCSMPLQPSGNVVEFQNLDELETDHRPNHCFKWIDFARESQSLRKLTLNGRFLNQEEFDQIAEANHNLAEFTARLQPDVKGETIVEFIKNSKSLKKINLKFAEPKEESERTFLGVLSILRNNFDNKSVISVINDKFEIQVVRSV